MILLEDTRNKVGSHENVKRYCESHDISIVRTKLDVGDYMLPDGKITVDTKQDLLELSRNLMNRADSSRFWREIRRSHEQGIKLVVLIESGRTAKTINDVAHWKSKFSGVRGRDLVDEMIRLEFSYGVRWAFCDKRSTGRKIIEILTGEEAEKALSTVK